MATVHRHGKRLNNVWSIDQVYAGIPADQICQCGHASSEHLCKFQRTKTISQKCDECPCIAYVPVIELALIQGGKAK